MNLANNRNRSFSVRTSSDWVLPCIDPHPIEEQDLLLESAQSPKALESLNQLQDLLKKMSTHFRKLSHDFKKIISIEGIDIPADSQIPNLNLAISKSCHEISVAIRERCVKPLESFKTEIVEPISQLREEYIHSQVEFTKVLEPYASINPNTRVELIQSIENQLTESMATRAGSYYVLSRAVESLRNKRLPCFLATIFEAPTAVIQFLNPLAKQYDHAELLRVQEAKNLYVPIISSVPRNNTCVTIARQYLATRFEGARNSNRLLKPCGICWYRSHTIRTKWVRKYLTFAAGKLTISDFQPPGKDLSWDLALVTTQPVKKRKRRYVFKLQGPEDAIQLQAFTRLDMDEWLTIFTNHNARLLGETECVEKCADCGAPSATWISLNWSVFLCLKCSGVHRQLSSSVSKVRSISLDHLHPWLVALHTSLGDLANSLLLRNHTPNSQLPNDQDSSNSQNSQGSQNPQNLISSLNSKSSQDLQNLQNSQNSKNPKNSKNSKSSKSSQNSDLEVNSSAPLLQTAKAPHQTQLMAARRQSSSPITSFHKKNSQVDFCCPIPPLPSSNLAESHGEDRIDPRSDEATRSAYITNKYVKKEWAELESIPDPFEAIRAKSLRDLYCAMNFGRAADTDANGLKPIHAAVCSGVPELAALAVACSSDVDMLDDHGWTPLQHAIFCKQTEIAKFLISQKANPEKGPLLILAHARGEEEIFAQLCLMVHDFKIDDDDLWLTVQAASLEYVPQELREQLGPIEINIALVEAVRTKRNQILHL